MSWFSAFDSSGIRFLIPDLLVSLHAEQGADENDFVHYSINVVILKTCTTSICSFADHIPVENSNFTEELGVILVSSELTKLLITGVPLAWQIGVL